MPIEKRSENRAEKRHGRRGNRGRHGRDTDEFWNKIGVDIESMSPKAQAVVGLTAGGGILAAVAFLLVTHPQFFWLIFIFGWAVFPAFGVFVRGIAGLAETRTEPSPASNRERELLEALRKEGELSPAQAAMETSLTVAEADKMLGELAAKGHLEVRTRGGGIFYALWGSGDRAEELEEGL